MKVRERENRDSTLIIVLILLVGFACIVLASGWAIRFMPSWRLPANMGSSLNPNSDFLTNRPLGLLEPLDPAILTNPAWYDVFLTPGATFNTRTPQPTTTPGITPSRTSVPTLTFTATPTVFIPLPINTATNTPVINLPTRTSVPPATFTPTPTPSNTPVSGVDLLITKTDNVTIYAAGIAVRYIITVSNPVGPGTVTANVADNFSSNLTNVTWICAGISGATCTSSGTGNINDIAVILPSGSFVIYTVDATVVASPNGDLVNTATVNSPGDPDLSNNSATDIDTLTVTDPVPPEIGTTPDGIFYGLPGGGMLTMNIPTVVNGHPGPDLIYYELLNTSSMPPAVFLDWVIIQVGDGTNWYTVFYWGDEAPDTNTNMNYTGLPDPIFIPAPPPYEPDQRDIPPTYFYNTSGVTIELDGFVPPGTYPWLRIISPPGGADNNLEIDGIATCPSAACP